MDANVADKAAHSRKSTAMGKVLEFCLALFFTSTKTGQALEVKVQALLLCLSRRL